MATEHTPVTITISMLKGGVGKTDIAFNFAMWLAIEKNHKVLAIDLDENCNFSQVLNVYSQQGTVANILKSTGDVEIHKINENIDLIAGFNRLHDVQEDMATKENKAMKLYMWIVDNYDELNIGDYDFIIIDTHNDFGTATKNAVAVSDVIFSPIIPLDFSDAVSMKVKLEEFRGEVIDFKTRESYIKADLRLIGNMIKHNTAISHDFSNYIKGNPDFVARFPFKEIFTKSIQEKKSITELLSKTRNRKDREFKAEYDEQMEKLYNVAKRYEE